MIIKEMIICKGCGETTTVEPTHHYCKACIEDINRIKKSNELSLEVKDFIINNYSKYLQWLIKQHEKPEYDAEYHTFMETCQDFYINKH